MEHLYNHAYFALLVIANIIAFAQLIAAVNWPSVSKISFFILFAWAAYINWKTSQQTPDVYLGYADTAWAGLYKNFITGWFASHVKTMVGFIAICQGLIAISMLLRGWIFKIGAIGAIVFLIAIIPLGEGSGFPCTLIMAAAVLALYQTANKHFWRKTSAIKYALD